MSSSSLRGYVYYVSLRYDLSFKTWIYFLKGKSEVFSKFKDIKPWSRTKRIGISILFGKIMTNISEQKNSRNHVETMGLRGI